MLVTLTNPCLPYLHVYQHTHTHTPTDLQWVAIFLWSACTLPQLRVNSRLGSSSGQANLTVLITVIGKTADVLSAFLVNEVRIIQAGCMCVYMYV